MPQGLPRLRSGPSRQVDLLPNQVVAWIPQRQKKGGNRNESLQARPGVLVGDLDRRRAPMRSLETSNRRQAETLEQACRDELHARRFQLPKLQTGDALRRTLCPIPGRR